MQFIKDILNLFKDCVFDGYLTDYNYHDKILVHLPESFSYTSTKGATKLILMPRDVDFVIKIPFNGGQHWDGTMIPFYHAGCSACEDENWNYCETERIIAWVAKDYKISRCFVKNNYIGDVDHHPIYIQRRVCTYSLSSPPPYKKTKSYKEISQSFCDSHYFNCFNPIWLSDFMEYYGKQSFYSFMEFIEDECINDLHSGNIGYIGNKPVVFDYAGWHEDD